MQEVDVKSSRNPRTPLSIATIHTAALELIEKNGLEALSMRSLATTLSVDPMAMYHHIPNKAALILGLYNTVLAELIPSSASTESWQDGLKTLARQYRTLALRHPKLFPSLIASSDDTENAYRAFERLYGLMLRSGLSLEQVVHASDAFFAFVTGFALIEIHDANAAPTPSVLEHLAQVNPSDYPHIKRLMSEIATVKVLGSFEFGLQALIVGLEQALTVPRADRVDE